MKCWMKRPTVRSSRDTSLARTCETSSSTPTSPRSSQTSRARMGTNRARRQSRLAHVRDRRRVIEVGRSSAPAVSPPTGLLHDARLVRCSPRSSSICELVTIRVRGFSSSADDRSLPKVYSSQRHALPPSSVGGAIRSLPYRRKSPDRIGAPRTCSPARVCAHDAPTRQHPSATSSLPASRCSQPSTHLMSASCYPSTMSFTFAP